MHDHAVQFFANDLGRLTANVAGFLEEGLRRGEGALVVASPALRDALRERIGTVNVTYLDDRETLAQFMRPDGFPDPGRFDAVIGTRARRAAQRYGRFRAYGEMVSVLWSQGACEAALQLEGLWNGLMQKVAFDLFCGYAIDVLANDFQLGTVHPLLATHTRVASSVEPAFNTALERAMEEVWGDERHSLHSLVHQDFAAVGASMPPAERTILRLRSSLPRYAEGILENARASTQK